MAAIKKIVEEFGVDLDKLRFVDPFVKAKYLDLSANLHDRLEIIVPDFDEMDKDELKEWAEVLGWDVERGGLPSTDELHERYLENEPIYEFGWPVPIQPEEITNKHLLFIAKHLPIVLLYDHEDDEVIAALTGVGMDLTFELIDVYLIFGILPPPVLVRSLPNLAGFDKEALKLYLRVAVESWHRLSELVMARIEDYHCRLASID